MSRVLFAALGLVGEDKLKEGGHRSWPAEHSRRDPRVGQQVRERPRRLRLRGAPHDAVEQPVDHGAAARGHDGRTPSGAGSGDVGEQRGDPHLEPRAHLVVGGRQDGHERLAEHPARRPRVPHLLRHARGGRPGPR